MYREKKPQVTALAGTATCRDDATNNSNRSILSQIEFCKLSPFFETVSSETFCRISINLNPGSPNHIQTYRQNQQAAETFIDDAVLP
jgi:hypothetical protein